MTEAQTDGNILDQAWRDRPGVSAEGTRLPTRAQIAAETAAHAAALDKSKRRIRNGAFVAGGMAAGIVLDGVTGGHMAAGVENLVAEDSVVAEIPFDLLQGDILGAKTDEQAHLLLDSTKIDPSKVDFNIDTAVNDALHQEADLLEGGMPPAGARYTLELIDQGGSYTFKLIPDSVPNESGPEPNDGMVTD